VHVVVASGSDESWRADEARAALDARIEIKGPPSAGRGYAPAMPGVLPYYMPTLSKQYVSVAWSGEMGLQLQRGFMQATVQLTPLWVPAERAVPESQQGEVVHADVPRPPSVRKGVRDDGNADGGMRQQLLPGREAADRLTVSVLRCDDRCWVSRG
jgi:hypothetical protein